VRALVAGWFSFPWMGATAGDLLAADVVGSWLTSAGCPYDVAVAPTVGAGVDALTVDPALYSHLVFVCGPLGAGEPAIGLFQRFRGARLIGVDLSMLQPVPEWNPFHLLLERDSSRAARPDIAIMTEPILVRVAAVVLAHEQHEYEQGRHQDITREVDAAVHRLGMARVLVDTCLDPPNLTGLRSPAEVLSVLARADVIVTTRLHGLVLGLRVGVPVVAIDPIVGGAKVTRQAEVLGWKELISADHADAGTISLAISRCLLPGARTAVRDCVERAQANLLGTRAAFMAEFSGSSLEAG